jgi:3D (Asp-Asp-Asp) domain-containing protein
MIQLPSIKMDRFSARMLVVGCVVLAIGLAAAAGARLHNTDLQVRFIDSTVSEPATDDLDLATTAAYVISPVTEPALPGEEEMTSLLPPAAPPAEMQPRTRQILMEVTAYCPCPRCCGEWADGITASGKPVSYNNSRFVAADTRMLPFGTELIIPGYNGGRPVEVQDRGGAIKGHKLDLFFPTHQEALQWGRQRLMVTVVE